MTDVQTMDEADKPRTIRAPDAVWKPFLQLAQVAETLSGSDVLRRAMQEYLTRYRVFWAPEHPDIDPEQKPVAWYECEEHQDVHRLVPTTDERTRAPWGCSVTKSFQDRIEKESTK